MKKRLSITILAAFLCAALTNPAFGAAKAGGSCTKLGATSTVSGKKFTCVKSGKKLVWDAGVVIAKPSSTTPSSTSQIPTISPRADFAETSVCKLAKPSNLTMDDGPIGSVGFPKNQNAFSSTGSIKGLILLADFSDVIATSETKTQIRSAWLSSSIPNAEKLFTYSSYGKFKVKVDISDKVYRMQKPSTYYDLEADPSGGPLPNAAPPKIDEAILDAMTVADPEINFSQYAFVTVSTPQSPTLALSGASGLGRIQKQFDGITYSQGDFIPLDSLTPLNKPFKTLNFTHDIGHMLGLLHPYKTGGPATGAWDIMWSFAFQNDFLGWNKWKLDWITDDQISCVSLNSSHEVIEMLSPIGITSSSKKIVVIKLSDTNALAVEVRRKSPFEDLKPADEGVIVYAVDTTKPQGQGPYTIISNPNKMITYQNFPQILGTMKTGEFVTYGGYVISVLKSVADGDYVSIKKKA